MLQNDVLFFFLCYSGFGMRSIVLAPRTMPLHLVVCCPAVLPPRTKNACSPPLFLLENRQKWGQQPAAPTKHTPPSTNGLACFVCLGCFMYAYNTTQSNFARVFFNTTLRVTWYSYRIAVCVVCDPPCAGRRARAWRYPSSLHRFCTAAWWRWRWRRGAGRS